MARPAALEKTRHMRVNYQDYIMLHSATTKKKPQPDTPSNKPLIQVYQSDHDTLQSMARQKAARQNKDVSLADVLHDVIAVYGDSDSIPVPDPPGVTIPNIVHAMLKSLKTKQ